MRKTWLSLMLLTFIFLVPLAGCGFLSGSQERFGTDELSVYGLKLGDDKQKLLNTLGVPKAKDIHHWEKIDPILYLYDKLSFFLLDDKIAGIASEDKEFATKRGVGIGDAFAKLVDAYASDGLRGVFGGPVTSCLPAVVIVWATAIWPRSKSTSRHRSPSTSPRRIPVAAAIR